MLLLSGLLSLVLLSQPAATPPQQPPQPVNPCDSLIITQTRAALADLKAAAAIHTAPAPSGLTAVYEGTIHLEGHLMRPGMTRSLPARLEFTIDPSSHTACIREAIGRPGAARTETTLLHHGRVAIQPAADKPFTESDPDAAAITSAEVSRWLPSSAIHAALAAAASCRPGPTLDDHGRPLSPITFTDAAGKARTLLLDADHRLQRIESLSAHQRLGDICDWTSFDDWQLDGAVAIPKRLTRFVVQPSQTIRYELSLVSAATTPIPESAFLLPADRSADIPTWAQAPDPTAGMEFVPLAPSIWSVEIAAADARVLIIERPLDLILLGAPDGDAICGALIRALRARFPDKPLGTVAFGHHHPSPSGGLRALAATGATIIAPRELEPYIRSLMALPTSLGTPATPAPENLRLELFDRETTIECRELSIRLIDIAEQSTHAFHYVVFYLPGPGILFEDDLGYFPLQGAPNVSPRLIGLADALATLNIQPKRLLQLWPVKGVHREVEWSLIADLVAAERTRRQAK